MSNITLSSGVRQNLLALQDTSREMTITQNRLATGKKVNSALDNPINYFTSQSLDARATSLSALLDSIGQAVQTLTAADQGITSLTSLVQSMKSIATQAEQSTKGSVNYTNITGSTTILADRSRDTSATAITTGLGGKIANVKGSYAINLSSFASVSNHDTLALTDGTTTTTFEYKTSGALNAASDVAFSDAATLKTAIAAAFAGATVATSGAGGSTLTVTSSNIADYATNYTATGTAGSLITLGSSTSATSGDVLTVNDGTHTSTFRYVAANASAAALTFTDAATLAAAVNNAASSVSSDITAATAGAGNNQLQLDAAKTVSILTGGSLSTAFGYGTSATTDNYNSTLAGLSGQLTVQVGSDVANTLTFGTGNGQISTGTQLAAALAAITDITGSVNSSNNLNFAPQSTANVVLGGTASILTAFGLASGTNTPTSSVVTPDATRTNLQNQYNAALIQLDQLAGDASYNGVNLINGDNLKVIFNETDTSSLTIAGVKLNSAGLGLSSIAGTGFQDNNQIDLTISTLNTALSTLRAQASTFGSNLTTVQTRQDFTNNLISTLQTGSNNLVLADTNQEGANMLALQTRQQLSITALSLSAQSANAVLKLFG
jgi:flagellin